MPSSRPQAPPEKEADTSYLTGRAAKGPLAADRGGESRKRKTCMRLLGFLVPPPGLNLSGPRAPRLQPTTTTLTRHLLPSLTRLHGITISFDDFAAALPRWLVRSRTSFGAFVAFTFYHCPLPTWYSSLVVAQSSLWQGGGVFDVGGFFMSWSVPSTSSTALGRGPHRPCFGGSQIPTSGLAIHVFVPFLPRVNPEKIGTLCRPVALAQTFLHALLNSNPLPACLRCPILLPAPYLYLRPTMVKEALPCKSLIRADNDSRT